MGDQALVWIDSAGATTALRSGTDTVTQVGAQGRFSPTPLFIAERVPLQPGQRFRNIVHGPLSVAVPVALRPFVGTTLQAENGVLSSGATFHNDHTGYNGTGFVALAGLTNDDTLTVTVPAAGSYNLDIRYANGNGVSKTLSVYVNGTKLGSFTFPATATWDTWGDVIVSATLRVGANTIDLLYDTGDTGNFNVDQVGVSWTGAAGQTLRGTIRAWARALDPVRGDGTLRVTDPYGVTRDLVCRCTGGLDQLVEDDWSDARGQAPVVLHFTAEQPYWTDSSDTVQSWQQASNLATFFPFFPLRLSDSTIFADATVDNTAGDVEAWPVWTILGPGSNPILRNLSSGKILSLPVTLLAGESVTIDTRPGRKTVTKQDGTSLFGLLAGPPALWSLLASQVNSVRVEYSSTVAGSSQVQLNWRKRYLSA